MNEILQFIGTSASMFSIPLAIILYFKASDLRQNKIRLDIKCFSYSVNQLMIQQQFGEMIALLDRISENIERVLIGHLWGMEFTTKSLTTRQPKVKAWLKGLPHVCVNPHFHFTNEIIVNHSCMT